MQDGSSTGVSLAPEEPYVTTFESTVEAVAGRDVTLDRTYFYPEGGGQPADRGTVAGVEVVDVQTRDGATVHTLSESPAFGVGDTVEGTIDESFRTYAMRAHTASHVVYGAGRKLLDDHGYGGFGIGEERIRMDFEAGADADAIDPLTVQRLANEAVWDARAVEWYELDAAEARADDEIVFNLGTDGGADTGTVRIVEIEGWDVSACGGTHVANTIEIGPIAVVDVSNPGAGLVRVEYAVGPEAIDHGIEIRRSAERAAGALDTGVTDLPRRAESLVEENESLRAELADVTDRLLDARLASLSENAVERDGESWIVGTVDAAGPNEVADRIGGVEGAEVVAIAGRDGSTFVVVAADEADTDAGAVVADVTDTFGGGGGGRPTLAQGGGIDAAPGAVAEYLREE
ncbi:MAG: alanyl-tRNA editing protein [Salinirussus sp.]